MKAKTSRKTSNAVAMANDPFGWLVVKDSEGNLTKDRFMLVMEENSIGRSEEMDLVIDHCSVSRQHCKIIFDATTNTFSVQNLTNKAHVVCDGEVVQPGEVAPLHQHLMVGVCGFLLHPSPKYLPIVHSDEDNFSVEGTPIILHSGDKEDEEAGTVFDRFVATPMRGLRRLLTPRMTPGKRVKTPKSAKASKKDEPVAITGVLAKRAHKNPLRDRAAARQSFFHKVQQLDDDDDDVEMESIAEAEETKEQTPARTPVEATPRRSGKVEQTPQSNRRRSDRIAADTKEESSPEVDMEASEEEPAPESSPLRQPSPEPELEAESEEEDDMMPYTMEELQALKWLELRSVCKQHGITARTKDQYLALALPRCKDYKQ
ncbi:FHA domain [Carpediemonas membranifera]|uniref:FHA domain n=1 Tax=Carpediemonas membranifera TaxID=201153 RepID=A0A8J6B8S0_9EUKA|nr:FHA domain [Carpediemonas membranifera]|eukprot:KAG9395534.1 FHA domain [Carpediemonas membranifera]